jgi:hypothetical protein
MYMYVVTQGSKWDLLMKKTEGKKSRATVPLKYIPRSDFKFFSDFSKFTR